MIAFKPHDSFFTEHSYIIVVKHILSLNMRSDILCNGNIRLNFADTSDHGKHSWS